MILNILIFMFVINNLMFFYVILAVPLPARKASVLVRIVLICLHFSFS